jgi:hypothetical protein
MASPTSGAVHYRECQKKFAFGYLRFTPVAFVYLRCASVLESRATEHGSRSRTGNYFWQMLYERKQRS